MKQTHMTGPDACGPEQLKRMALQRLCQRLEEDQMTTAELLKVAALPDTEAQTHVPGGEWVITLKD